MLTVEGCPIVASRSSSELLGILESSEVLLPANDNFLAKLKSRTGDIREEMRDKKCLVVLQREMATAQTRGEPPLLIGSEDATTCVIAVAKCSETGWVCATHVDDGNLMKETVEALLGDMINPVIYLVGAYRDKKGTGVNVAASLLRELHSDKRAIDVKLACLGSRNTSPEGKPIARDLLLDT
jgi:hypothetical protein